MDAAVDLLRSLEQFATAHKDLLEFLIAGGSIFGFLLLVAVWLKGKLWPPEPADPKLSDPPVAERSLARYSTRAVELLGRDEAMARLQAFLDCEGGFAWMQIAGVGGQGKSRLGYELTLRARDQGWRAGLLESGTDLEAFAEVRASWQPGQPHLIVLDYVVGRESQIGPVIQTLARRAGELRKPVRLLLLERQRWDRGGLGALGRSVGPGLAPSAESEGRADWFVKLAERHDGNDTALDATRFEDGVLELKRLEPSDLIAIVRRIEELEGAGTALPDPAIAERLQRIDSAGRPLYAYFLGQALAAGGPAGPGWSRDDLLDAALERDWGSRWQRFLGGSAPCLGDGSPAERIAVVATIAGGLDCAAAARRGLIPHADEDTRRRALVLTDGPMSSGVSGPSQVVPALQPDLLGEWLVLRAFAGGLPAGECLDLAWRSAPDRTAAFLQRLTQDFPDDPVTAELLEREPPGEAAAQALARVASPIVVNLYRAHRPFPQPILTALTAAAQAGDGRAMASLGGCYALGQGVERDPVQAANWYRKGAQAGDVRAMANLGRCYALGEGVERDPTQGADWFRKGAQAGDGEAMANLGVCYAKGLGVERDPAQGANWYRKGAEAGDGGAMANLGVCYAQGLGVERDPAQAADWFRKGAEAGDVRAMGNLGVCYKYGQGVERDPAQAQHWGRKSAELGGGFANVNVELYCEWGQDVERDSAQAAEWRRKGDEAGDGRTMANLGLCYAQAQGVERAPTQAAGWFRGGAEASDEPAPAGLRRLQAVQALLAPRPERDGLVDDRPRQLAAGLGRADWLDTPPLPGDWDDLTGVAAAAVLARLWPRLQAAGLELASIEIRRLRQLHLSFYRGCALADVQLQRPGPATPVLVSALVSAGGAALLDGTSGLLHAINPDLLALDGDTATLAYLRFFCAFVRGEDGPFQIVDDICALPMDDGSRDALPPEVRQAIAPPCALNGDLATDGWRRFDACVLYGNALFRATFKVLSTGIVEMEDVQPIASDLPIRMRRYDGIFRTPLSDPAGA